jgi:hypothetical protein
VLSDWLYRADATGAEAVFSPFSNECGSTLEHGNEFYTSSAPWGIEGISGPRETWTELVFIKQ